MAGMLFLVCVPTAEYEKEHTIKSAGDLIRLDLEPGPSRVNRAFTGEQPWKRKKDPVIVPMEKILEELLKKLGIEHAVWCGDKNKNYYQVFFPVGAGDPCENCLHCLTELGIGKKNNSVVSVVPCSVFFQGLDAEAGLDDEEDTRDPSQKKAWNNFVQSIRSKLTVKQVVDGVRSGGECSFDYLLLILTADMVAAVGLVENNSVNIVAAMLISPLMGPIMAGTFGTVIADKKLQKIGVRSELIGLFVSLIFGFIFGLLVGTTQSPWGLGDWPTEEMKGRYVNDGALRSTLKGPLEFLGHFLTRVYEDARGKVGKHPLTGRGNARSLWIGILWALPSGTGVALALLQGSAGPLIGVAISASLLPPAVNCGIMWGLACIVLIYHGDLKLPHLKGEAYTGNTSYVNLYSTHLPSELAAMGIISFCLTLINICCIFITAIIVLKIKEVAAPYTSSPDLRRFWQHDIRIARDTNRATINSNNRTTLQPPPVGKPGAKQSEMDPEELGMTLEAAVREAVDDATFRKVKGISYSHSAADVTSALGLSSGPGPSSGPVDPELLDQLIHTLMNLHKTKPGFDRNKSWRRGSTKTSKAASNRASYILGQMAQGQGPPTAGSSTLPTILEARSIPKGRPMSLTERVANAPVIRNVFGGAPHKFNGEEDLESVSLTDNQ